MLRRAGRPHVRQLGAHRAQPDRPRRDVLVLLPERARDPHLVEALHNHSPDRAVRDRHR